MKLKGDLPTVLFPVEIITRELDSKLVVGLSLAARGCRAIIGHKEAIGFIGRASKKVVWQGKDAFSMNTPASANGHFADRLRANGSCVMFVQDEGAVFHAKSWTQSLLWKYRAEYLRERRFSRVCTWGERQKEVLTGHGVAPAEGIAVTGCPRFDLCSPRYGWVESAGVAEALTPRRPYILMVTRFDSISHLEGPSRVFRMRNEAESLDSDLHLATWRRDAHDFIEFVVLAREIARAFPDYDVILRPHPSEDADLYRHAFAPYETITVTKEGSALYWIRSAELVIHNNCTTGIEAVLAGRRVLNMRSEAVPRADFDKEVAKEAGLSASSIRDAIEKAAKLLKAPPPLQIWSAQAYAILANLKTDAVPVVVNETLKVMSEEHIDSSEVALPSRMSLRGLARNVLKRGVPTRYVRSKRGPLDINHIENVVDGYASECGGTGRIRHAAPDYVVIGPM